MFDSHVNPKRVEGPDPLDAASLLVRLRETPTSVLEASFRELDTLENATGAYKLLVLSVLDERDVGREDGTLDTVGWVTWTARLSKGRARGLVATARALPDRPAISTAALEGRLSAEQLAAVVQVATRRRMRVGRSTRRAGPRRHSWPRPAISRP